MSSRNPFRTPAITPASTGASATSPFLPLASIPDYAPPPAPPPRPPPPHHPPSSPVSTPPDSRSPSPEHLPDLPAHPPSTSPRLPAEPAPPVPPRPTVTISPPPPISPSPPPPALPGRPSPSPIVDADLLSTDLPPAYTPAPNFDEGESSVDFGPRRPFQRVPQPPPAPAPVPAPQPYYTPPPGPPRRVPPPLSPVPTGSSSSTNRRASSAREAPAPLSDFAREFYAAGAGDPNGAAPTVPQPRYAPPPGEPPTRRPRSANSSAPSASGSRAGADAAPDDGRPTREPVPGHPLLHDGQLLVYPAGFECHKCKNTGYKNYDPSHPCRGCWSKYARPFGGALAYSPWSADPTTAAASSSNRQMSFQRPLPSFAPPQSASAFVSSTVPTAASPATFSAHRRVVSQPQSRPQMGMRGAMGSTNRARLLGWGQAPPPGALVLRPGDPRLGGRLCVNCGGSGMVPFFLFEEVQCERCGGVGRVFS